MNIAGSPLARPLRLGPGLRLRLGGARAVVALAILVVTFSALSSSFFTTGNLVILAKHVAINAILAIGMTFVVLAGGIDLSVGSVAGLAGMVAGALIHRGTPVAAVIPAGLAVGAAVGLGNGLLVARLRVPPFVATLGTLYLARGLALLSSNGATFPDLAGPSGDGAFSWLGAARLLGLPSPIYLMILLGAAASFVTTRTPFGRHVLAVGGNERAAALAGVPVARTKVAVYVISGACAALAGLVLASQLGAAHPATGEGFELGAIAAVVLGGTSLAGGVGTVGGTLLGAFVVGVLDDGLVLLGVSEFWQMVCKGIVIVLAVVSDRLAGGGGRAP
jgi:erythritol transport system permease protein